MAGDKCSDVPHCGVHMPVFIVIGWLSFIAEEHGHVISKAIMTVHLEPIKMKTIFQLKNEEEMDIKTYLWPKQ